MADHASDRQDGRQRLMVRVKTDADNLSFVSRLQVHSQSFHEIIKWKKVDRQVEQWRITNLISNEKDPGVISAPAVPAQRVIPESTEKESK